MAEKLKYGKEYDLYDSLIRQANSLPRDDAKKALGKIQLELFMKYGIEDEKVKILLRKFNYSV